MEEWKDIPEYEGLYQISNLGRVKSLKRKADNGTNIRTVKEKILKQSPFSGSDYLRVGLTKNGKIKTKRVHQLVAIAFLGHNPKQNKIVVDHINNDKSDNRLENLQLLTQRQNVNKDVKSSSKYDGVCWYQPYNKWLARIGFGYNRKFLGYFESEIDAHNAYQKALELAE